MPTNGEWRSGWTDPSVISLHGWLLTRDFHRWWPCPVCHVSKMTNARITGDLILFIGSIQVSLGGVISLSLRQTITQYRLPQKGSRSCVLPIKVETFMCDYSIVPWSLNGWLIIQSMNPRWILLWSLNGWLIIEQLTNDVWSFNKLFPIEGMVERLWDNVTSCEHHELHH